jgi:8-oxo-dGTP pyrophosphatase MutT (NUDIX family)
MGGRNKRQSWTLAAGLAMVRAMTADPPHPTIRPSDAATLIIMRRDGGTTRVLMGRRHSSHAFLPGSYVFPGGRVDTADCRFKPAADLDPAVAEKLMVKMRGRPSLARARGLAMAAVRETFEEVGLIVGTPIGERPRTRSAPWQAFLDTGYAPDLSGLRYLARAITPPGRPRRFDTRFFVLDAAHVANSTAPAKVTQELLDPCWVALDETSELQLPDITKDVLERLEAALGAPSGLRPGAPLAFQYLRAGSWMIETI